MSEEPKPPPGVIKAIHARIGPPLFGRLRCSLRRRFGGRHSYRKGEAWCSLCGRVKATRKAKGVQA